MIVTTSVVEPALTDCPSDRPTDTTVPLMGLVSCASARSSWALINDALAESIDAWSLASCSGAVRGGRPISEEEEPWSDGVVRGAGGGRRAGGGSRASRGAGRSGARLGPTVVGPAADWMSFQESSRWMSIRRGSSSDPRPGWRRTMSTCAHPVNSLASVASACADHRLIGLDLFLCRERLGQCFRSTRTGLSSRVEALPVAFDVARGLGRRPCRCCPLLVDDTPAGACAWLRA